MRKGNVYILIVGLFLFGSVLLEKISISEDNLKDNSYYWITIQAEDGDTLWELVKKNQKDWQRDFNYLVELTKKQNQISDKITVGQRIEIPIEQ